MHALLGYAARARPHGHSSVAPPPRVIRHRARRGTVATSSTSPERRHRMYRRTEVDTLGGAADPGALPALRRPDAGGLAQLFDRRPMFRRRHRGYDRFQVDEYVAWAEAELDAARRQCDYLLSRYGACTAQLEIMRQAPRRSVSGPVSERLGQMLRLASEEAQAI